MEKVWLPLVDYNAVIQFLEGLQNSIRKLEIMVQDLKAVKENKLRNMDPRT